ncbi:MAG: S24 family peptidase [Simplicispira sp.]|nr:S24 family peptidase [Simplicispira sp.]
MFKATVNTVCKQFVENAQMHETARRLYAAIAHATSHKRTELGDVAAYIGVTPQVLKNWESRGVSKQGRLDLHSKFGINPDWIDAGAGEMLTNASIEPEQSNIADGPAIKGVYPLISKVQAGMWTELCDQFQPGHADEWLPSTKNLGKCGYMLRVEGKSMENPGGRPSFSDGMVLHVNPHLDPHPGNYVVVRRDTTQEATFKRYVMIDGEPYLEAINPDWPKDMKYLPLRPGDAWCGVVVDASFGGLI